MPSIKQSIRLFFLGCIALLLATASAAEEEPGNLRPRRYSLEDGTRRGATYTNPAPGSHTLRVRGSNSDAVRTEQEIGLRLRSLPPPLGSGWAYALYLLLLGAIVALNMNSRRRKRQRAEELAQANRQLQAEVVQRRAKERALKSERRAKEAAESASRAKSQFLANMSHEIRTPMSVLLGSLELLQDSPLDGSQTALADNARRSASSLLDILNDVLDLSKIEAGKLELEAINFGLGEPIADVQDLFAPGGSTPLAPLRQAAAAPAVDDMAATILLVEDNAEVRMTVLAMLEKLGFVGQAVDNGLQAVEAIGRRRYDLIFMDCQMPTMDGYEATRRIRRLERRERAGRNGRAAMPILAMTAGALAGDRERCLSEGMDDYLRKPFTLDTLHDFLRRFLGDASAAAGPRQQPPAGHETARRAAQAPATVPPPIDFETLRRIDALGTGPSGDLLSRIVRSYLETAPKMIAELRRAAGNEDGESISAAAHRLKGASAQLGIGRVAGLCTELERIGNSNGNDNAMAPLTALLGELEKEIGRAQVELEQECLRIAS